MCTLTVNSVVMKVSSRSVTSLMTAPGVIYLATVSASCSFVLMCLRALTSACSPGRWLWLSSQNLQQSDSNTTSQSSKQFLWKCGRPFVMNVFHFCFCVYLYGILGVLAFWFALGLGRPEAEKDTNPLLVAVRKRGVGLNGRWTRVLFWPMFCILKEYLPFSIHLDELNVCSVCTEV
jgi:hypothetical protein